MPHRHGGFRGFSQFKERIDGYRRKGQEDSRIGAFPEENRHSPGAIRMDQGDPAFPTPPHIQEAALKAMRENFTHYGNAFGEEDLREAICFILPLQKACVAAIRGPQDCVQQMVSKFDQRRKVAD